MSDKIYITNLGTGNVSERYTDPFTMIGVPVTSSHMYRIKRPDYPTDRPEHDRSQTFRHAVYKLLGLTL